ncbi:MAG: DegV family protein [Eubacteriales bacterium]|nr:DegV family protein [Eubacteriales bacterium]
MNKVIISTDCVADLPEEARKRLHIPVMHYYISTRKARFQDMFEMDSGALIDYIEAHEDFPRSSSASAEEYREYFLKLQKSAPAGIIHISMAKNSSEGFQNATEAARGMEQVYVVDSGVLSSSVAILVLYAADLSRRGCPLPVLLEAIEKKKKKLSSSFVVRDVEYMIRGGKMNEKIGDIVKGLRLQPLFMLKDSKIILQDFFLGGEKYYARSYINYILRRQSTIDPSVLFITTAGCTEAFQNWLCEEAKKKVKWDRIILQPASATISCNCGPGSFGFLFARK